MGRGLLGILTIRNAASCISAGFLRSSDTRLGIGYCQARYVILSRASSRCLGVRSRLVPEYLVSWPGGAPDEETSGKNNSHAVSKPMFCSGAWMMSRFA